MRSIGRCVAERPMRCGRPLAERVEPLERQRQVRAALVARHRVDLVDDHRAHAAQALAAARGGEQQVSDSGVVTRMCGGRCSMAARARGGRVAACAASTRSSGTAQPELARDRRGSPRAARSRFCWMSAASALSGET